MRARGQVTLFVIIGLFLLILFIFLFLLHNAFTGLTEGAGAAYETAKVESYVGACIDSVTEEGVQLLSKQGGLLFTDQGGLHERDTTPLERQGIRPNSPERSFPPALDWPVYKLENGQRPWYGPNQPAAHDLISFGLARASDSLFSPPSDCKPCPTCAPACTDRLNAPDYPWPNNAWNDLADLQGPNSPLQPYLGLATMTERNSEGPYGDYVLPRLCDPDGPNANTLGNPNLRCREIVDSPERLHGPSIQESLATYISLHLSSCIDEERLSEILGASVTRGAPNATVTFSKNRLIVDLDLPLTFTRDNTVRLGHFSRNYDIRLYKLYSFIYFLLKTASKDPSARIDDQAFYSTVRSYDGFTVGQRRLPFATGHRKDLLLVTVTDPYSVVKRNTLTFQFLIENRPPILENYHGTLSLQPYENQPFPWIVPITALDPDGEHIEAHLDLPVGNQVVKDQNGHEYPQHPSPLVGGAAPKFAYDLRGRHPFDIESIDCPPPQDGPCLLVNEVPANLTLQNVRLVVNDTPPLNYPSRRNDLATGQDWELVSLVIGDTHS